MSGGGETIALNICTFIAPKALTEETTADFYLHAVIFIIHILDPGNELTSIEAISHRFVLVTLRTDTKLQWRLVTLVRKIKLFLIIFVIDYSGLIKCTVNVPTWLSDGILYTSESNSMVQALNGTA